MFAFRFALRNVLSRRSSAVIVLFITFTLALLVISNAVFDGTDSGMEHTYVNSFTGNIVICPKSDFPISLFGDETPVTGELSEIPLLIPFSEVNDCVRNTEGITSVIPQITGMAVIDINEENVPVSLFGVVGDEYIADMSGIRMLSGRPYTSGERGLMLSDNALALIEDDAETTLHVGDMVKLIMTDGASFTIRAVPLTGIYSYDVRNYTLDKIALIDPETLRALMGVQDTSDDIEIDDSLKNLMECSSSGNFDELFFSSEDTTGTDAGILDVAALLQDDEDETEIPAAQNNTWSYLICRTDKHLSPKKLIRSLNATFKENDWPVQAINWRTAAGGSVVYVFYLRIIMTVGIILILLPGFIVINNTLTISALGRVCETGTLRAIGASQRFIALQFLSETALLTVSAGILGCILGGAASILINRADIQLGNSLLVQLFGGNRINAVLTLTNILRCLAISVALAFLGWLYPVHVAMESNPIVAMRGQV